jgi:hypothetical protein
MLFVFRRVFSGVACMVCEKFVSNRVRMMIHMGE